MKRTKVEWLVPALAAAMLAGAGLWGSSAEATVMVELTLEDMARDAVAIVHGRVVRSSGQPPAARWHRRALHPDHSRHDRVAQGAGRRAGRAS